MNKSSLGPPLVMMLIVSCSNQCSDRSCIVASERWPYASPADQARGLRVKYRTIALASDAMRVPAFHLGQGDNEVSMTSGTRREPRPDAIQERKQRELEERRKAILKIVRKRVLQGGAHAISMRKVAEEAGFSTTIVYSIFHDKATMIGQAMDDDLLRLNRAMGRAVASGDTAIEKTKLALLAYVDFGLRNPRQYQLVFMEKRPPATVESSMLEFGNPSMDPYQFFYTVVSQLAEEGYVGATPDELQTITQALWETMHGMTSLRVAIGDDPWVPWTDSDAHARHMIDLVLLGVLAKWPGKRHAAATKAILASK